MHGSRQRFYAIALSCLFPLASLGGQATVSVPLQDPVYRDLDRLSGAGLVETMLYGQRPYSRSEIGRIISDAMRAPNSARADDVTRRLIARLASDYSFEIARLRGDTATARNVPLDAVRLRGLGLDSPKRAIPDDPINKSQADVNPLLDYDAGRTFSQGANLEIESLQSYQSGRHFALQARPRLVVGGTTVGSIEALSGSLLLRNILIEAGRQQLVWGQGMEDGLVFSTSSRPLDMIRVTNDLPWRGPGVLRHLGPMRWSAFIADLGPNQTFPHSKIIAYKASGNPFTSRFEFGLFVASEQGGDGSLHASLHDRIVDLIPALRRSNRGQISNRFAGWEYRVRVPEWSGLQLYIEHALDDADPRRWGSSFWEDAGHIAGFSLSRLGAARALSMTAEYHHTGVRYFQHGDFTSGWTFNRTLIGDPLGNEGNAGYLRLRWDNGGAHALSIDAAVERRGGDSITTASEGPHEDNFHFVTVATFPKEWRHRIVANWSWWAGARSQVVVKAGYERATNFNFVDGASRNNFLGSASVQLYSPVARR
jgi:hypothetical protein